MDSYTLSCMQLPSQLINKRLDTSIGRGYFPVLYGERTIGDPGLLADGGLIRKT